MIGRERLFFLTEREKNKQTKLTRRSSAGFWTWFIKSGFNNLHIVETLLIRISQWMAQAESGYGLLEVMGRGVYIWVL